MSDLPKQIGPFEVRDRLGHGGMGVVYLAFDPMLDRLVAIKVLRVPDAETRRRFLREARLAAKVHHPHIVSIYAVGEHEAQPFLAMEYIAGSTLAAIIRGSDPVALARKVTWLAELCSGLNHAHRSGIVHRDVKPSNLLISRDSGLLRLLDFGIAHGQEAGGMTMAGMVIGTPQYMSPEQITGRQADARSDIFSVGLVAYELLSGRQAFGGENLFDISRRIVGEPPVPLKSLCQDAPMALVRVIEKCLEKEPEARYQDARQLERDLLALARRLDPEQTLAVEPITAPTMMHEPPAFSAVDNPSTAAAALGGKVREAVAADRLPEAELLLRNLEQRHAGAPGLNGLRVLVDEARQASQAVQLAADAERALGRANLTEARALLDDIERLAPMWSGLASLRHQLQSKQHERRVIEAIEHADANLDAGQLDDVEPALRHLASLAPTHPALTALRARYHSRLAAHQASTLAGRATAALQQNQLEEAAALVAEALAIAPDNNEALGVQEMLGRRRRAQRVARTATHGAVAAGTTGRQGVDNRGAPDLVLRTDREPRHAADAEVSHGRTRRTDVPHVPEDRPRQALPAWAPIGALVLIVVFAGLGYTAWTRQPPSSAAAPADVRVPSAGADDAAMPGPVAVVPVATLASTDAPAVPPVAASDEAPVPVADAPAAPAAESEREVVARVQQLASSGRYTEAFALLSQGGSVPAASVRAEQRRLATSAQQRAAVARRTASDFNTGGTDPFVQGASRQQLGEEHLAAGRLRPAVLEFVRAHDAFEQAMATRTARAAGPAPPPVGPPAAPAPPAAPSSAPAPVAQAPGAVVTDVMAPYTNEHVRQVLAQWRQYYEARNIEGLRRLWPTMDSAWERQLRGTFGIPGELQWYPSDQRVVRQPEQATVMATIRNITPMPEGAASGTSTSMLNLTIELTPRGDQLVITSIRQR